MHFGILGPLEVAHDGDLLELGRPKQRAVLALLLLHANRIVSVDRFADRLWPEEATARAAANLPVYIANLRRLLEPERPPRTPPQRLLTRAPGYILAIERAELDAACFEDLAGEGQHHLDGGRPRAAHRLLTEALALWRGRVLDEFSFAELEASRLEELRLMATEARLRAELALGGHAGAVAELERLTSEHGMREQLAGLLMLALYRSGRQAEALRAYARARAYLGDELGIEPGPELRRLEADIHAQSPALDWVPPAAEAPVERLAPPPSSPPAAWDCAPLVGRTTELAAVRAGVEALRRGQGAIVLVAGEPGIGKTRLAYESVLAAQAQGCAVAWGRCDEGDGAPPFWPWIQVLRGLMAQFDGDALGTALAGDGGGVAHLVPELQELTRGSAMLPPAGDPAAARFRLFEAVGAFLARLSAVRPLAVVLDDLHWADAPSLELAVHLAASGLTALLVLTFRDVDPEPIPSLEAALARLARAPRRIDVPLARLTHPEVAEYLAHAADAEPPPGLVEAVWDRTGGNPFFVGELTRLLLAEKGLTEAGAKTAEVPWAVRQVIGRRLARLPAATADVLTVAAVVGQAFDVRVVASVAGLELDRALDLLDSAVAAGLLVDPRTSAERLQFSHALVQQTVFEGIPALRRARLHGEVADALERLDGEGVRSSEIAHHLHEAVAVVGARRAIAAAGAAAAAAQEALAFEVAEDHLARALALVTTLKPGWERDRLELDVQVQLAALLTLVKGVAVPQTAAAWSRATDLCREDEDQRRFLAALWGMFSFAWASGDLDGGRAMGEHILRLGRATADPVATAAAHLAIGGVALCAGDLDDGSAHLEAGKALADPVADDLLAAVTHADLRVQLDSWLGMARHLQRRHDQGAALLAGVVRRARRLGDPFTVAIGLAFAVFGGLLGDDPDEAGDRSRELLDHAGTHQLADFVLHAGLAQAWTAAQGGRGASAAEVGLADRVAALPPATDAGIRPWRPFWLALRAEVWIRTGNAEAASADLDRAFAEVAAMGSSFCLAELHRLRAELAAGAPECLPAAVAELGEAVRVATDQGALLFRDRAEASLARLSSAGPRPPVARGRHRTGSGAVASPSPRRRP